MDWISLTLTITACLVLVFAGRRFFWLAAGMIAFLFAFNLFNKAFGGGWSGVILAVAMGAICAWLALLFVKTFSYLAGAVGGAVGMPVLLSLLGIQWNWWLMALIGLLTGLLLVRLAFNWGLIFLTAWTGAYSLVSKMAAWLILNKHLTLWIFIVVMGTGIIVQAVQLRRKY